MATSLMGMRNRSSIPPSIIKTVRMKFDHVCPNSIRDVCLALERVDVTAEQLLQYLPDPGLFPYSRQPIILSQHVEVLAMNWAPEQVCAPHDHGQSIGWIRILSGTASNTEYILDEYGRPDDAHVTELRQGETVFVRRGLIHSMGRVGNEPLVTLHAYTPPIKNMKVYDLARCLACEVSDDCGAWWPPEQRQKLKVYQLAANQVVCS